ncbi:metal-dependent transcriptional regulator [Calidifontibacter terrae]
MSTTALAAVLEVTGPTVSAMMKRFLTHELVRRSGRQLVLTDHGRGHAEAIIRRSRLIETFLVQVVGVPWDEAPVEADLLEHAVSDRLLERFDVLLGRPLADPHGDPIPRPGEDHVETWGTCLAAMGNGDVFVIDRLRHDDPGALAYLADRGLVPGAVCSISGWAPYGGPVRLAVNGHRHDVGPGLLALVYGHRLSVPQDRSSNCPPVEGSQASLKAARSTRRTTRNS